MAQACCQCLIGSRFRILHLSDLRNLASTTQDLTGLTDDVVFNYTYDVLGRKTSVAAEIGANDDYVNTYSYDNLGRITQITQDGVSGGNAVAEKRVDFAYSDDATRATISRFADLDGTKAVAETEQIFDELGRVTDIVHERAATEFADYDLTWDAASRISDFDFESLVGDDGDASYSYDDTNQITGADYSSDWQSDESYVYDENGNRTLVDGSTSYTTGAHNRLTSDGTYNYTYDNEGNVLTKTNISTSESVEYTWDHRNRLVKVTFKNSGGTPTQIVEYAYDYGQRWVRKTLDTNADQTIEESRVFVHDNGQIVLDFEKAGTGAASNSDLAHRYLWGNSVDQLLVDETVDDGTADDAAWALTDHLNSVRDLVVFNPGTEIVTVQKHVAYDAFGNVADDTATGVDSLFLYTARPFDPDTELQNNLNRWYDLSTGRWMSVDPIGFEAGDVNLYRYVANQVLSARDPSGLQPANTQNVGKWRLRIIDFGQPALEVRLYYHNSHEYEDFSFLAGEDIAPSTEELWDDLKETTLKQVLKIALKALDITGSRIMRRITPPTAETSEELFARSVEVKLIIQDIDYELHQCVDPFYWSPYWRNQVTGSVDLDMGTIAAISYPNGYKMLDNQGIQDVMRDIGIVVDRAIAVMGGRRPSPVPGSQGGVDLSGRSLSKEALVSVCPETRFELVSGRNLMGSEGRSSSAV